MEDLVTEEFIEEADDTLELRILHGPQAGSTLPMELAQAYMLGSADSCAVLLAGTQVEAEHVEVTADSEGIHITPVQGRVMTIDRNEVSAGQAVALGTVLRLGRVKLTVDKVDAPWPHEDALEEPDPVIPTPQATEEEQTPEPEQAPAAVAPQKTQAQAQAARRRTLIPSILFGVAATLLVGAAVASWVTSRKTEPPADAAASPAAIVASADPADAASAPAAKAPAMPEADRLAAVTRFIDKRRVPGDTELKVEPGTAGEIRISGAIATQAKLAALKDAARTELASAGPVNFAVLTRSELPERFEERLRQAGIVSKFKLIRREPEMELQAQLNGNEVRIWENLFMDFTRDYGGVLTIRAQVHQERDMVEAQIQSVVAGAFPYVVTTSGRRVAPGGVLEGRTLSAIRDGELIFADGARVRYAY